MSNHKEDNIDRRGFLSCMSWVGAGMIWTMAGGIPRSRLLAADAAETPVGFSFVQISDSHIGFSKPANPDVAATLQVAVDKINALPTQPDFLIHTGDITHLAKPAEFDSAAQLLSGLNSKQLFYVPGEHDTAGDDGKEFLSRFGKGTQGSGWYSYNHKGVHFIALVNVLQLEGMGKLGAAQVAWIKKDLAAQSSSTPIVAFAHIPLWTVYPEWSWGTQDSEQLLTLLKRFGSVTVLNGHIHQVMQKVEGSLTFHTAMSTAFPQPAPGKAPSPGPMKVPAEQLRNVLGLTNVVFVPGNNSLALVDSSLSA